MKTLASAVACVLLSASLASAAPITLFQAPTNTYQNTANNPCLFFGPGGSGCNQDPAGWPTPTGDTGGGDPFNPNPLTKSFTGADLTSFATNVGREFLLGLDINDTSTAQTLSTATVNFFNNMNVNIGSFTFGPPTLTVPNGSNGLGYADYILAAGCAGVTTGSGNTALCSAYSPFVAPLGTRRVDFSFGLTGFNDGPDKLFLISAGPGGVPTPFCTVDPCEDVTPVPEPASLVLLGTGLLATLRGYRRRATPRT
jgi:hypothetical protein